MDLKWLFCCVSNTVQGKDDTDADFNSKKTQSVEIRNSMDSEIFQPKRKPA